MVTNSRASIYSQRFDQVSTEWLSQNSSYFEVDEDNNGTTEYGFDRPDFNFGQFRSNMVVRWEYIPGSTVFLVWTPERKGAFYDTHPEHDKYSFDFHEKGHNIFLLKYTYPFVL